MEYKNINEDSIARTVEQMVKKEGTFDTIRKQATEKLRNSETMQSLYKELQAKVERILKYNEHMNKEDIQRRVKNTIDNDFRLRDEIHSLTHSELQESWVSDIIEKDVHGKVEDQLNLHFGN